MWWSGIDGRPARLPALRLVRAPLVDEGRDQPGPAGLVRGAEARAGVAVEVLVEHEVVAPVRIVLELRDRCRRPGAGRRRRARRSRSAGRPSRRRDLADRPAAARRLPSIDDVVAVGGGQLAQRLDHQERGREPDRAAPVRVAALDLATSASAGS